MRLIRPQQRAGRSIHWLAKCHFLKLGSSKNNLYLRSFVHCKPWAVLQQQPGSILACHMTKNVKSTTTTYDTFSTIQIKSLQFQKLDVLHPSQFIFIPSGNFLSVNTNQLQLVLSCSSGATFEP